MPCSSASSPGLRGQELVENVATFEGLGGTGPPVLRGPLSVDRTGRPGRPVPAERKADTESLHESERKAPRPPRPFPARAWIARRWTVPPRPRVAYDSFAKSQERVGEDTAVSECLCWICGALISVGSLQGREQGEVSDLPTSGGDFRKMPKSQPSRQTGYRIV